MLKEVTVKPETPFTANPTRRRVSPRTTSLPLAFTAEEFFRGVIVAWLAFNVLYLLASLGLSLFDSITAQRPILMLLQSVPLVMLYTVPVSAVVAFTYGAGAAFILGGALRSSSALGRHRVAFLLLGALAGAGSATFLAYFTYSGSSLLDAIFSTQTVVCTISGAVSVWLGWEFTRSLALKADRRAENTRSDATSQLT